MSSSLSGTVEEFFDCVSLRSECFHRAVEGVGMANMELSNHSTQGWRWRSPSIRDVLFFFKATFIEVSGDQMFIRYKGMHCKN
jgi:hypothetical protein